MPSVGANIRAVRQKLGYTIEQLALRAQVDTSNLSKIERDIGGYSRDSLERIANGLGVPIGTLFGELPEDNLSLLGKKRVPIIDEAQVRAYFSGKSGPQHFSHSEQVLMDNTENGRIFAFRIKDHSTAPEFRIGDLVIINIDAQPKPGSFVAVDRQSEGIAIRQYRVKGYDSNDQPILEYAAINPAYPSFSSSNGNVLMVGVVIEHRRRFD